MSRLIRLDSVSVLLATLLLGACAATPPPPLPQTSANSVLDGPVRALMARESVQGLALAVIRNGQLRQLAVYGYQDAATGIPLRESSVMAAASWTKTAVAYRVLQLVDQRRLDLDAGPASILRNPLPTYQRPGADYSDLKQDARWRAFSPRVLLTHGSGLANFRRFEPDGRLRIHFDPGSRYAYSGEGYQIMQFMLEQGLGLRLARTMEQEVFTPLGMLETSLVWQSRYALRAVTGYDATGQAVAFDQRQQADAAGSMATTISDQARFWAALVRGEGLSQWARSELVRPQRVIATPHQFPTLTGDLSAPYAQIGLAAGLGVITYQGPAGQVWFKGGHDVGTGNLAICVEPTGDCLVMMSNDVRAERIYPEISRMVLGDIGFPWRWEYSWLPEDAVPR